MSTDTRHPDDHQWEQVSDGITLAWRHHDTGLVVELAERGIVKEQDMLHPMTSTDGTQYVVQVRESRSSPTIWPKRDPTDPQIWDQRGTAMDVAYQIRTHIEQNNGLNEPEVTLE